MAAERDPWDWGDWAEDLYDDDRLGFWPEGDDYRQSATACCPRETIPDSCSCLDGCDCMCTDCICGAWGEEYEDEPLACGDTTW